MKKTIKAFFLFLSFITLSMGIALATPVVESVAISGDKLIVTGHQFLDIDGLTLSDPQTGFKKPFKVESATESEIVGTAVDDQKITVASLMNLIIDTAKGETTYPVSFSLQNDAVTNSTIKDGAITPEKFIGITTSNPPDQSVLTWDDPTQSFIFTAKNASTQGEGGGVSDIVLGAGIIGAPKTATGSVPISVDIGATGNASKTKIPYFNSKNKIVLDSTSSAAGSLTGLHFKDGTQNFYIFNDNGLRISGAAPDLFVLGVDGNLSLKGPVTVGGYDVCLSSGNCPGGGSIDATTVTATLPLVASGTTNVNISAGAVNTANNLVKLDSAGKFPSTIPGVVRGPGTVTSGTLAIYSNTTGENLGNSNIGLQNLVTMSATPTTANKIIISTGTNKVLGSTAYTIPSTSGVTGQILAITATNTVNWVNAPASGVTSFNNRTGAVRPDAGDYTAAQVGSVPLGIITGNTVQQALDQLTNLKLNLAGGTMTGTITTTTRNALKVGPWSAGTGEIQFEEQPEESATNAKRTKQINNYVGFKSPAYLATNTVWTLPAVDGTVGQVLSTNGAKVLSWTSAGAGGSGNVTGPSSSRADMVVAFTDTTGKVIKDTGTAFTDLMQMYGSGSLASGNVITTAGGKSAQDSLVSLSNIPTMASNATAQFQPILSRGNNKTLGAAPYTLPNVTGVTGQVLGLTAAGTANWINASSGVSGVSSFKTRTGAVVPVAGDYTATLVTSTAGGSVAATTVQAAITELDSEKLPIAGGTMTGTLTTSTQSAIKIGPYASGTSEIQFLETAANGTGYVGFKSPASVAANTVWTLPPADGNAGQVLSTNGSQGLSWTSAGAGGGVSAVQDPATATNTTGTSIAIFSGEGLTTITNSFWKLNGIQLEGPTAFVGENSTFKNMNVGCFSNMLFNSSSSYGFCQDSTGDASLGTTNKVDFNVGGTTKLSVGSAITTHQNHFVNTGNLVVDTNTFFVNSATNVVGIGTTGPVQVLEINSTTKGFLPPRMTTAQKNAITPQSTGLVVFDTDLNALNVRSSTGWTTLGTGSSGTGDVAGPATSTLNNFAAFSDTSGKNLKDSGINSGNLPTMATAATVANKIIISAGANKQLTTTGYPIPVTIGANGTVLKSNGTSVTWQADSGGSGNVIGPVSSKANNLAIYGDATGKWIQDSSVSAADLVIMSGAGSPIAGNVVITAAGKLVADSNINLSNIPTMPANATLQNAPILGVAGQKVQVAAPYTLPNKTCSTGQILKYDAAVTGFTCQADMGGLASVPGDTSPLPLATLDTTIAIYSGEDGQTIKHSLWKLNGIQIEGPTAFIGENSTFKGQNVGCFSNMLFNSSNSYGLCQDSTGDASLGTTSKMDFNVGGNTKLAIGASITTHNNHLVNNGNLVVDTNTFFVNSATNNVGIGTTNPLQAFQIDSTTKGFVPPRMTTTQKNLINPQTPGMMVFDTTMNSLSLRTTEKWVLLGSAATLGIANLSDLRLKKNIKSLDLDVFEVLDKLNPVTFEWKNQIKGLRGDGPQFGFVAQEVEKVLPNLVITNDDGNKGVNEIAMIPILMEAIKKQQKQIAQLQGKGPVDGLTIYNPTTNSPGNGKPVGAAPTVREPDGTTYTMAASDCGNNVALKNASAITVSVPALTPGCEIDIVQTGAGQVTVTGAGITVGNIFGLYKTRGQYSVVTVKLINSSLAILVGDVN